MESEVGQFTCDGHPEGLKARWEQGDTSSPGMRRRILEWLEEDLTEGPVTHSEDESTDLSGSDNPEGRNR